VLDGAAEKSTKTHATRRRLVLDSTTTEALKSLRRDGVGGGDGEVVEEDVHVAAECLVVAVDLGPGGGPAASARPA
jgi:hypothetical protein